MTDHRLREARQLLCDWVCATYDERRDKTVMRCTRETEAFLAATRPNDAALADSATTQNDDALWQTAAQLVRNLRELDEHEWQPDEAALRDVVETTSGFFATSDAPPELTEEMVVRVDHEMDPDCWVVKIDGEYIQHFTYEGDAHGMASRLKRAITQEVKP